jgi:hypothetical protein
MNAQNHYAVEGVPIPKQKLNTSEPFRLHVANADELNVESICTEDEVGVCPSHTILFC